ncbi:trypsin-like serine peptidase [Microbispora sp. NBC_01389]|uniref:trypsin-like serine peptidase n=1 Tax=Microbispora sp. NBC_01389 TaxID=2903584 RepID=UPI003247CCED
MKRTLTLGGMAAGLLATAVVATPAANAANDVSANSLAKTNLAAQQVAAFWYGEDAANLINATPYGVETKVVAKHISKGGPSADSKPGVVPAIGDEKKSAAKSKNVNLPKTTGKVFFLGADGKPHWCTGTSVQSAYHNVVATAGHCVYDTESNAATLDKWVFIPGYYQTKTPWGIYVGKTAYTHYDYDVYEDGDRDYAFVTVYNGVKVESRGVSSSSTDGGKDWGTFETRAEAEKKVKDLQDAKETGASKLEITPVVDWAHKVALGTPDSQKVAASVAQLAVDPATIGTARTTLENWAKGHLGASTYTDNTWGSVVTETYRNSATGWNSNNATKQTTFVFAQGNKKYKATFWGNFDTDYQVTGKVLSIGLSDVGRLGDNVGGQGLAYNQKLGQPVFVFGYPSGSHPDGNHAFTGHTLKWTYGKTFAAKAPAIKAEELQAVKSSFTGEGALGSSWLLKYNNGRRLGYLNGVTIGVSDTDGNDRYDTSVSPYFDGETYGVYKAAANLWSGKIV